jgi:hypothetical protein
MTLRDAAPLTRGTTWVVLLLCVAACGRETTSPPAHSVDLGSAVAPNSKTPAGPAVTSASPSFGDQGTTLDVHVFGSGFGADAQATWLLHGVANGHVRTNSTTFVSSTEVVANITIDNTATLDLWDVQISTGGKNGVGSDAFEVTAAQVLSFQTVTAVQGTNNLGDVVGYTTNDAFVYDDATGFVDLGAHQGWALDPTGTVAFGADGTGNAIEWMRQPDGTWTHQFLPAAPNSVGRFATSAARTADGTLLVAGVDATGSKNSSNNRPVVWQQNGSSWSAPTIYAYPAGVTAAFARTVNALGEVGGQVNGSTTGAVWDSPTISVQVDGLPNAINSAGTLMVGQKLAGGTMAPAYWWRDPATQAWHTVGVLLPTVAGGGCSSGIARGMNDALVVVGESCNGGGKDQATVWHLDFSGASPTVVGSPTALSGLHSTGVSPISVAVGISQTAPYVIGGSAASGSSRLVVRWLLPQ